MHLPLDRNVSRRGQAAQNWLQPYTFWLQLNRLLLPDPQHCQPSLPRGQQNLKSDGIIAHLVAVYHVH